MKFTFDISTTTVLLSTTLGSDCTPPSFSALFAPGPLLTSWPNLIEIQGNPILQRIEENSLTFCTTPRRRGS